MHDRWYTLSALTYANVKSVIQQPGLITSSVPVSKVEQVVSVGHTQSALCLIEEKDVLVRPTCLINQSVQPVRGTISG